VLDHITPNNGVAGYHQGAQAPKRLLVCFATSPNC